MLPDVVAIALIVLFGLIAAACVAGMVYEIGKALLGAIRERLGY